MEISDTVSVKIKWGNVKKAHLSAYQMVIFPSLPFKWSAESTTKEDLWPAGKEASENPWG